MSMQTSTNTSNRRFGLAAVLACAAGLCTNALAQVATPPPAELKDPAKEFPVPPAPPAVEMQPSQAQPVRAKAQAPELPKDVNYDILVKRDDAGKLIPLSEPAHLAALRVNPKLTPGFMDGLGDFLTDRRSRLVHFMISNLDIVEKIDEGIFETAVKDNKEGLTKLMDTVKPIVQSPAPKSISDELRDKQLLDPTQWLVNTQIVRRYTLANTGAVDANAATAQKGQAAWNALIQLYKAMTEEYSLLLREGTKKLVTEGEAIMTPELANKLAQLPAENALDAAKLSSVRESLAQASKLAAGTPEYAAAIKTFREATTLEQRKVMYEAALGKN